MKKYSWREKAVLEVEGKLKGAISFPAQDHGIRSSMIANSFSISLSVPRGAEMPSARWREGVGRPPEPALFLRGRFPLR
jgi:hypothetical protein